ncbi:phenylalanine 4-monooxygenase [Motiliproteus coralliicola]|uniref:Phenylalanine-4-hydroxylase n=1 Tax=Motiliproteus coralliicola TaxID=2283196 RepID=A0A369WY87_9GAMM|nr:phenylalanine 4-monooxygenase [Motiliproteus coralliicola]RDE24455.1 phenylalanine 4-monooxygenase [Motiliproteus coralliicola]
MKSASTYRARQPDRHGLIEYPDEENQTWQRLMERQLPILPGRACPEYLDGLERLQLPVDRIPQLPEINRVLERCSGWQVSPVPALISFDKFFELLANQRFPVATFIRRADEIDYLQEPDIYHEIFGHCPMLTHPRFAEFTQTYGRLGAKANPQQRAFLARLYWLTVEFGLIRTDDGIRIYGGGILSSHAETLYCLEQPKPDPEARPIHQDFDLQTVLRTPYRIDILQPIYFVINNLDTLWQLARRNLLDDVAKAQQRGLLAPLFEPVKAS